MTALTFRNLSGANNNQRVIGYRKKHAASRGFLAAAAT